MSACARVAVTAAATAALVGGSVLPAAAQSGIGRDSHHTYTCSNKGGGPNHTTNCTGVITVGDVLMPITITVGDVNVLNNLQLDDLEMDLANIADNSVNIDQHLQLLRLRGGVINTYLQKFGTLVESRKVKVCALSACV